MNLTVANDMEDEEQFMDPEFDLAKYAKKVLQVRYCFVGVHDITLQRWMGGVYYIGFDIQSEQLLIRFLVTNPLFIIYNFQINST